jgi:DNA-binding CsgD family transcriptional regulator
MNSEAKSTRPDATRARQVRDLRIALSSAPFHGATALDSHITEIRNVLRADVAMAYGVVDAGDHVELAFMHGSGAVDPRHIRERFGHWLRSFPGRTGWAAYNPLHPERQQRNRVVGTGHLRTPIAQQLYPLIGLDGNDCVRVLICEGATFLAWVGIYTDRTIRRWQRMALGSLVEPLRKRLVAERKLARYTATRGALDALLACTPNAAFLVTGNEIEAANDAARRTLRADRKGTVAGVRDAVRGETAASLYDAILLDRCGEQCSYLILDRARSGPMHLASAAAAQTRFGLSVRQTEVLERVLQGMSGPEIARALGISPNTLEKHFAALYERVGVHTRAALVAHVTAV